MGWLSSLPTGYQVSKRAVTEKHWYSVLGDLRYSYRTITTTVYRYDAMTLAAANNEASGMNSDTTDTYGAGTKITANVERLNAAGAYSIVKTTVVTTSWTEVDPS